MAVELLYMRRCEHDGCEAWNGAIRRHPDPEPEREDKSMLRMGWSIRPDLCPAHNPDR